jgi:hypothetical protein
MAFDLANALASDVVLLPYRLEGHLLTRLSETESTDYDSARALWQPAEKLFGNRSG